MLIAGDRYQCVPERIQTIERKIGPDGNNNVTAIGKFRPVTAKDFSNQSFDPVSPNRIANFSLDAYSQTVPCQGIGQYNDGKTIAVVPFSGPIDALKLPVGPQKMFFGECIPIQSAQTASCLRPFARLLRITACPFFVFMRTRNPWVRARLVLLG